MSAKSEVWICTPLRSFAANGVLTEAHFDSLEEHYREPIRQLSHAKEIPWDFHLCLTGGGGVARARNKQVSWFLASKAERLFFVDYDLMPTAQDYVNILRWNLGVIGGNYTTREENGHYVFNRLTGVVPDEKTGLMQVMELGTGFKCYHRTVFEQIAEKNPWLEYTCDDTGKKEWGFFSMGPVTDKNYWPGVSRWLTEDYWLDWLTRDAGIPIVVDTAVKLRHKDGENIYPKEFAPI